MSRLREAAIGFARTGAHPLLPVERLFAMERVAAGLETRRIVAAEHHTDLAEHATERGLGALSVEGRRRLLAGLWGNRIYSRLASDLVGHLLALDRRSTDRALVETYLRRYPVDHPAFEALRAAAALAADRHAWGWREAGRHWRLWEGPAALGAALRQAEDLADGSCAVLREAGFVGSLVRGGFVSAARADAARSAP